jgi:hypothetical protein
MLVGEMSEGAQETPGRRFGPQAAVEEQGTADEQPDVLLDVRELKVDEIHLEVDDLQAHVSLLAEVLTLLKLQVGADVSLAKVSLDIKGVEAVAVLKVRLDNVAAIIDRVMTTIDNNPQIIADLTGGLGAAAGELGQGGGEAVEEAGEGAGRAVEGIGEDAGPAARPAGGVIGQMVDELAPDGGKTDQRSRRSGPRG